MLQASKQASNIEVYSIGIDRERKHDHFLNLNLADYSYMFGNNHMWDELSKLPKPDLIIASPPCESWSTASSMNNGNACWKYDTIENLFGEMRGSTFVVRDYKDYENYQYYPERQILTRINGELCVYNTIQIIKKFNPKVFVIENPAYGKIWEYIEKILGFNLPYENLTYYNNYGFDYPKPTRFSSNIYLKLNAERKRGDRSVLDCNGYNQRSNIPLDLIKHIYSKVKEEL